MDLGFAREIAHTVQAHAVDAGKVLAWAVGVVGGGTAIWSRWAPGIKRRWRIRQLRRGKLVRKPKMGELREVSERYGMEVLHPEIRGQVNRLMRLAAAASRKVS